MSKKQYPTVEYLRQCLRYEDGKLFWLQRPVEHFKSAYFQVRWNTRWSGKLAGGLTECGVASHSHLSWIVRIHGNHLLRHVVVWALHNGEWKLGIDHKNGNSLDDRIENLRLATGTQNAANSKLRVNNTSGYKGVTWSKKREKWIAQLQISGKGIYLGQFDDPAIAHSAYMKKAKEVFGEFARFS